MFPEIIKNFIDKLIEKEFVKVIIANFDKKQIILDIILDTNQIYQDSKLVISHQDLTFWLYINYFYIDSLNLNNYRNYEFTKRKETGTIIIDKINYVCCSADTRHYNPVSSFKLQKVFQQLPKHTYRFLQEPWRADEKILKRPQNDMVLYPNGHTNVEATIELLGDKYKK